MFAGEDFGEAKEDEDVILLDDAQKKETPEVSKADGDVKPAASKGGWFDEIVL